MNQTGGVRQMYWGSAAQATTASNRQGGRSGRKTATRRLFRSEGRTTARGMPPPPPVSGREEEPRGGP
jgi:hypothetical protein